MDGGPQALDPHSGFPQERKPWVPPRILRCMTVGGEIGLGVGMIGGATYGYSAGRSNADAPPALGAALAGMAFGAIGWVVGVTAGLFYALCTPDPRPGSGVEAETVQPFEGAPERERELGIQAQSEPGDAAVWEQLGDAEVSNGHLDLARKSYGWALHLSPNDAHLKYKIAALQNP